MLYFFIIFNLIFMYFFVKKDIQFNKIYNKDLKKYFMLFLVLKAIDFYKNGIVLDYKFYIISILIPFIFYLFKMWGAGDSKLLTLYFLALPSSIVNEEGLIYIFKYLNTLFIVSFLFFFIEGCIYTFKHKKYDINLKKIFQRLFKTTYILFGLNTINFFVEQYFSLDRYLLFIFNLILVFLFNLFSERVSDKIVRFGAIILIGINIFLGINLSLKTIILCSIIIFLKEMIHKSNYEIINVQDIKPGMILSRESVFKFTKSRVRNLPRFTDETKNTTLTEEESLAIKRWEKSKYGEETIEIIKKVPFSIYISLTYILSIIYYVFKGL